MVGNGKRIKVDFPMFSLRQSYYCYLEKIEIYENSFTGSAKARYCGNGPKTYTSQSNVLHVVYTSKEVPTKSNFFAQYSVIDKRGYLRILYIVLILMSANE